MSSYTKAKTDEYEYTGEKTKFQRFKSAIYNDRKGTCLGRSPKRWGLILIFYLIFYSCLSGFFLGMISVFMYGFVSKDQPMRTGKNSILTFTPGLNVNPRSNESTALIFGSSKNQSGTFKSYNKLIKSLFEKYNVQPSNSDGLICDETSNNQSTDVSKFCIFDLKHLGPCANPQNELLFNRLCIFVKVNKIYGWLPEIEKNSTTNDILVECEGQNPGDVNNLGKPVYYPSYEQNAKTYGRISNVYFPFVMQNGYTPPMVAVQFPNMIRNVLTIIQCSLKGIKNSYKATRFEALLFDQQ